MNDIKHTQMRDELIEHLRALSDRDYQLLAWRNEGDGENTPHDELDYAVHFLFDDTQLASDPQSMIGWVLKNETEAQAIKALADCLDGIFSKYGTNMLDKEYVQLDEWTAVLSTSKRALNILIE